MRRSKTISIFLSILILTSIILASPANAISLNLVLDKEQFTQDERITFRASLEKTTQEQIEKLQIMLEGPTNRSCEFDLEGQTQSPCNQIQIQQIENPNDDHGYGYGSDQTREYEITIQANSLETGSYTIKLIAHSQNQVIQTEEKNIEINQAEKQTCSLRAKEGKITLDQNEFETRNNLNLFSSQTSAKSQGFLTAQESDTRIAYNFIITSSRTTNNTVEFVTTGELKENRDAKTEETAIITFDKLANEITIQGQHFLAEKMKVTLSTC